LVQHSVQHPRLDRNQGNIRAARATSAPSADLRNVQNNFLNQVANSFSQYQSALAVVRRYEQDILPITRETLQLALKGYQSGETNFLTYLQVQKTMVQATLTTWTRLPTCGKTPWTSPGCSS